MSEIKGQLLGIILVIIIFGAVATGMATIFTNMTSSVSSEMAKAITVTSSAAVLTL